MLRVSSSFSRLLRQTSLQKQILNVQISNSGIRKKESKLDDINPIRRTFKILGNDIRNLKNYLMLESWERLNYSDPSFVERIDKKKNKKTKKYNWPEFQTHCDILVIGGGGMGSSVAYWLKKKARDGLNVVVVEKDCSYKEASTVLSVGGLRQQFSLPENIQMSLYCADFIRDSKQLLGDVDLNFMPHGYLTLASEEGAAILKRNSALQNDLGAKNEILTHEQLKIKFPWLNTEGIALGCHGLEKEGWFDPWALLMGLKNKAREYGAHFIDGEAVEFEFQAQTDVIVDGQHSEIYEGLDKAIIRLPNGEKRSVKFAICIIAAGSSSGKVAQLARIGVGSGILSVPLPVEPRKRYVYVFNSLGENAPGLSTPLIIDPNGTYFRREGLTGNYLCGRSPHISNEPPVNNLDVNHEYFDTDIWPTLAKRVKSFESIKVMSSWAGFYEYNVFDENGIIGPHPYYNNLYIATGFSGHGIQQVPAVGRAISELIIDGQFRTIDLTRLGFERIIVDQPMYEANIV